MKTSQKGVAEIAGHEGIVLSPYRDSAGTWTFGVGHTSAAGPPDPAALERGARRPLAAALEIFRDDLRRYEERVSRAVTVPLEQHEFDALVSFDFNTGGIFRAKLVKHLNAGDREAAAAGFDGWHRPPEIVPRRDAEKRLFRDGVYAHGGMATIYGADAAGRVDWASATRVDALEALAEPSHPRQPDDPGPGPARPPARPAPTSGAPDVGHSEREVGNTRLPGNLGIAGGAGAAFAGALAFGGKLALWLAAAAILAGIGVLLWRNRASLARAFGRTAGRAAR